MNASAYVVGSRRGSGAAIYDLAQSLGFETVLPYGSVAEAERQAEETPLCFFLFAEVPDLASLASPAQAIRFSGGRRVRFSPLIYFCANPSVDVIQRCIGMGFDDVITQPFSRKRVAARLARQVDTALTYFETSTYFGPDRRRNSAEHIANAERRGDGQYRRLEIIRDLKTGVNVLSDDLQVVL
jgi:hypothetical protein